MERTEIDRLDYEMSKALSELLSTSVLCPLEIAAILAA